jgi:predicted pyridoxine 5'-phosphate oxidase superfamily flavin-nucleotide-binding protein
LSSALSRSGVRVDNNDSGSPYHAGECEIQERVGVRERVEAAGRHSIRRFMPDQHRTFFTQLPTFFVGSSDAQRRPWASVMVGRPGFLQSPDPKRLDASARPFAGDPLNENLRGGAVVGALGLEFHTRRRNRVNGHVEMTGDGFAIHVDQSFGNCPQYIQARQFHFRERAGEASSPERLSALAGAAQAVVAKADTFFIASQAGGDAGDWRHGIDVSHRGGRPGFVAIEDERTLIWPDYRGNFFFNTLGNLAADPRCGLLFLDFDGGDVVQLTGRAEILWDFDRDDPRWRDAQRLVRFGMDEGVYLRDAVSLSWDFLSQAPQFAQG